MRLVLQLAYHSLEFGNSLTKPRTLVLNVSSFGRIVYFIDTDASLAKMCAATTRTLSVAHSLGCVAVKARLSRSIASTLAMVPLRRKAGSL